ncbi:lymphocyte function-associated antigen 3 isoform X2 [Monodelphis domestica]|uniref:lymphocyte function-associated antigen 3 isoform X2 n=1 Tax=Monodelphis domestica TaxID=13616 RepID=UPI000443663F|nr:lymphocyte function-associated antigen 3 isoform X2 [Monodelphis domestica]
MATELCWTSFQLRFALVLFILLDSGMCERNNIFGLRNESVTLSPSHKTKFKDITLKKNKDKVAEWLENSGSLWNSISFKGRITLDPQSGTFTILRAEASDEGQYEIESSSLPASESMTLHIVDKLLQPDLTCASDEENITVSCNMTEDSNFLNYSWNITEPHVHLSEKMVQLSRTVNLYQSVQCTVSNPMSKNESSLILRICVPETNGARNRYGIFGAVILPFLTVLYITGILEEKK